MDLFNGPHRRFNPLLEEWILVSPHRAQRPWSGKIESAAPSQRPSYDPQCYLCPGNSRASGKVNPSYASTYVFENDFPALLHDRILPHSIKDCNGLVKADAENGICRVICFSPRHDLTLAQMDEASIRTVIDLWIEQTVNLGAMNNISHVLIFENKGDLMGCSNPHPHGQIWSTQNIPHLPAKKIDSQVRYFQAHGSPMLLDYLEWELREGERIIAQNEHFASLVPFWATWPFEAMILPRRSIAALTELTDPERSAWAEILRDLTSRFDNLFETSFPYSMGINQLPTDGKEYHGLLFHQAFYPPLLRSASVRKFLVGYEMSAEPQRDITAEQAAGRLRECSGRHYLIR